MSFNTKQLHMISSSLTFTLHFARRTSIEEDFGVVTSSLFGREAADDEAAVPLLGLRFECVCALEIFAIFKLSFSVRFRLHDTLLFSES